MRGTPDVELLWRRAEACMAYGGGALAGLYLTSIRSEWLGDMERAIHQAAELHGGPVPMVAIFRLDERYPLGIDFDANLGDLAATLGRLRRSLGAVGMVLEFDGVLAAAMRLSVRVVAASARSSLPISVHPSVPQALHWLRVEAGFAAVSMRGALDTARALRDLLGVSERS